MPAFVELVVMDEFGICLLCPTLRRWIELIGKDAYRHRNGDAFDTEERNLRSEVLPIETRPGNKAIRQPGKRDIVQHIISCKAFGLPVERTRDHCQTTRVVIEKVTGYTDGGICDHVQRLRSQTHLVSVADALRIYQGDPLVRESLVGREIRRRRSARASSLVNIGRKDAWHI